MVEKRFSERYDTHSIWEKCKKYELVSGVYVNLFDLYRFLQEEYGFRYQPFAKHELFSQGVVSLISRERFPDVLNQTTYSDGGMGFIDPQTISDLENSNYGERPLDIICDEDISFLYNMLEYRSERNKISFMYF